MSTSRSSIVIALGAALLAAAHAHPAYAETTFPTVDASTQKARDDTRRQILTNELTTETKAAEDAVKAVAAAQQSKRPSSVISDMQQSADLHAKNVEALKRELAVIGNPVAAPSSSSTGPAKVRARMLRVSADDNRPAPYWDVYRRAQTQKVAADRDTTTQQAAPTNNAKN